jgi:hypothetical protein
LNDDEVFLISSLLGTCLNDFKLEQKYIASRIVVLPTLLSPYRIDIFFEKFRFSREVDLKSWMERDDIRTIRHA